MHSLRIEHLSVVHRILSYVKGTRQYILFTCHGHLKHMLTRQGPREIGGPL